MFEKTIISLFLLAIFYCLGSALFCLLARKKNPKGMGKALTWRIFLSVLLFLLLIVGAHIGWLHPHGL
jgi:hypothetical protein